MKTVSATEFKAHCLRLMDEVSRTGEPIEVTKRGKPLGVFAPPTPQEVDWTPGAFKDMVEVGGVCVDGIDLGIRWEALE